MIIFDRETRSIDYLVTSEGMWLAWQCDPAVSMESVPDVYGTV